MSLDCKTGQINVENESAGGKNKNIELGNLDFPPVLLDCVEDECSNK